MEEKQIKISSIKTNPNNPRLIRDDKFKKLVNSIREFPKMMALRPIVVDDNSMIIGGNMRFKALIEIGYSEISDSWVKRASDLTEEEKKRFIITDNVGFGDHDWSVLSECWDIDIMEKWGLDAPLELEDIKSKDFNDDEFIEEINKIKDQDAITPIIPDFMEDYNAFIIVTKNEIDEAFVRESFGLNKTTKNNKGLCPRKSNVISVDQLREIMLCR